MGVELTTDQWYIIATTGGLAGIWAIFALLGYALASTRKRGGTDDASGPPGVLERLAREPVRVRAAIVALLAVGGSFGLPVSGEQQAVIIGAVLGVLAIFSETTRAKVTPVAAPTVPKGTTVKRI